MKDLTGQKYGMLTVIQFSHVEKTNNKYRYYWICKCDCGNVVTRRADGLKNKNVIVSCGCYRKKILDAHNFKINNPNKSHGQTKTRLYKIYAKMKERCYYEKYPEYYLYGGRGIKVCEEWKNSFETFRTWALNNGYNETLSIDRIDPNRNYSPDNCRWANVYQQANNKRNNIQLTYQGETLTLPQWARKLNLPYSTLADRRKKGKSVEEILYPKKKR